MERIEMAEGSISSHNVRDYQGRITKFMLMSCIVASSCGLMFGYELGISGGVTSMNVFLEKFFPSVYRKMQVASSNPDNYCEFDSQLLILFISSLYIAGSIASLLTSRVSSVFGRRPTMTLGGTVFLMGATSNGLANDIAFLILGRILLGIGIGFIAQATPMYLSEIAPPKTRGTMIAIFQLMISIGIFLAYLMKYLTNKMEGGYGWRISLAFAVVPAIVTTVGTLFLPETPISLLEQGHEEDALAILRKIRGVNNVEEEFSDLIKASEASKQVKHPWRSILTKKYRPQFVMSILIPFFQQLTGINAIIFFAPFLYHTFGFGGRAFLMSVLPLITFLVIVLHSIKTIQSADRIGRSVIFYIIGSRMVILQVAIGVALPAFDATPSSIREPLLVFLILYTLLYTWSWGTLGWLIPSEIFQLEIRSVGLSINASVNLFMTGVIAHAFLPALCHLRFFLFFVFAVLIVIMTLFANYFVPETKDIPIENVSKVWKGHWYWSRFVSNDERWS